MQPPSGDLDGLVRRERSRERLLGQDLRRPALHVLEGSAGTVGDLADDAEELPAEVLVARAAARHGEAHAVVGEVPIGQVGMGRLAKERRVVPPAAPTCPPAFQKSSIILAGCCNYRLTVDIVPKNYF